MITLLVSFFVSEEYNIRTSNTRFLMYFIHISIQLIAVNSKKIYGEQWKTLSKYREKKNTIRYDITACLLSRLDYTEIPNTGLWQQKTKRTTEIYNRESIVFDRSINKLLPQKMLFCFLLATVTNVVKQRDEKDVNFHGRKSKTEKVN